MFESRSRARRGAAVLGVAALVLGLGTLSATAAPSGGKAGPKKGQAAVVSPAAPAPTQCDGTDPDSARDEFVSCVVADVNFLSTPSPGETATVELSVTADRNVANAEVSLAVDKEHFTFESTPGFGAGSTEPSGVGPVTKISRTEALSAGETVRYTVTVRAISSGTGVVQAQVSAGNVANNATDEAAVSMGQAAPLVNGAYATEKAPANAPMAPARPRKLPQAEVPVTGPRALAPSAPGASCATGTWVFQNELGQQTGSMNYQVQVYDQDTSGGDDLLAVGVTGGGGGYNICFESTDFDQGGGQEVYIRFVSSNNAWMVRNTAAANQTYDFATGVINIGDPGTANFGTLQPGDSTLFRALHAFDSLNLLYLWQSGVNGGCIDDPGQCRQMVLNWTPTSTDGTYYSPSDNDIHLDSNDPDSDHISIHEAAHALMDSIYEDALPPAPNCNPHSIFGPSSTGCAWVEGWAEWVPAMVLNDPFFRFEDGTGPNLETPGWTDGQARGDTVEGRVAGALIDLSDNANEAPWDRYGEGGSGAASEEIYTTNLTDVSNTLLEYFETDRPGEGDTGFLARTALFANTINYTQRDPLFNGNQLTRPSLSADPTPHNYSLNTANNYWSGVAIRGGNDNDLRLYDDAGLGTQLASSTFGGSTIDYVLVDSNERPLGDYFPQAYLFNGSGGYDVEWAAGATQFGVGSTSVSFGSGDVIQVRDAFASAGVQEYFRVVPSGGLDVELLAHDSDPATSSTWAQGRPSAIAQSSTGGAGAPEAITFTTPDSDWAGIVVLNRGGSGTATVYRDTTAPTGASVSINNGAATTPDPEVNLTLSAGDAETGIQDMRVAVDGVLDTENFQPYQTSLDVTLPGGFGTKTVTVEYRNNAGMTTTASDTIDYQPEPCNGLTPTITGSGTITGTAGNDIITGSSGADTINAGAGNDVICGRGGNDTVNGEAGNDVLVEGPNANGADMLNGGADVDIVDYSARTAAVSLSVTTAGNDGESGEGDSIVDDETLKGGSGNDTLTGGVGNQTLAGNGGNDTLTGGAGDDTVLGGAGNDVLREGAVASGADRLNGGADVDTVDYSLRTAAVSLSVTTAGNDGESGEGDSIVDDETLKGGSGNDTLTGGVGNQTLAGNGGNDTLTGGAGDDTVLGGAGNDVLREGAVASGADQLDGGADADTIDYSARSVAVIVTTTGVGNDGASGEGDTVLGAETIKGGAGDDTLTGGGGNETLTGNGGSDSLTGSAGNDTLTGGAGSDTLRGDAGSDQLFAADGVSGNDSVDGGLGTDSGTADPGDVVVSVP